MASMFLRVAPTAQKAFRDDSTRSLQNALFDVLDAIGMNNCGFQYSVG